MPQGKEHDDDLNTLRHDHSGSSEDTLLEETASLVTNVANLGHLDKREITNDILLEGRQIGRYDIRKFLGRGNMAVVYLAYDNLLERNVALKFLPSQHTLDQRRLKLFRQEAKAASALNHPNVITIHEIGEVAGAHFIATEFIEGVTLRELMLPGNLSLDEKLRIVIEIGKALDVTHLRGIVHGDVKPENTMIRPDGLVKVLDFGLSRLMQKETIDDREVGEAARGGGAEATHKGGTPRYMSPEKVQGEAGDPRSDIFSLGVLTYELCADRPPFVGETIRDLFDAILHHEAAPVTLYLKSAPRSLSLTLDKALKKNPGERYQTAGEMLADLERSRIELAQPSWWRKAAKLLPVISLFAVIAALAFWRLPQPETEDHPSEIRTLDKVRIGEGLGISRPSFSPDGKAIAYSKNTEGADNIWIKSLDDQTPRQVTFNGHLDQGPIWSPDGDELAFVSNRDEWYGIWKVSISGPAAPSRVAPLTGPGVSLCRWSKDGKRIYFQMAAALHQLELDSGRFTKLTDGGEIGKAHDFAVSPDESSVSYSLRVGNNQHIFVSSLNGNRPRQVTSGMSNHTDSAWLSDNRQLVCISHKTGATQISRVAIGGGKATRITFDDSSYEYVSASPVSDNLAAVATDSTASIISCGLDGREKIEQTGDPRNSLLFPDVSSVTGKVVFQRMLSATLFEGQLFMSTLGGKDAPELLAEKGADARWSPDGTAIAFVQLIDGNLHLFISRANERKAKLVASGVDVLGTTRVPVNQIGTNFSWSPDGTRLAYASVANGTEPSNIRIVSIDGAAPSLVTKNENPSLRLSSPVWSPDGRAIAFTRSPRDTRSSDKNEIIVIRDGLETTFFEEQFRPRLLGWSSSGNDVLLAVGSSAEPSLLQTVRLFKTSARARSGVNEYPIESAYLHSFRLAPGGRQIAFVRRSEGKDTISVVDLQTRKVSDLSRAGETGLYVSGLNWSSDGTRIFFSRQETVARVVSLEKSADRKTNR